MKKRLYLIVFAVAVPLFVAAAFLAKAEKSWDEEADERAAQEEMYSDEEMAAVEMGGSVTGTILSVNVADKTMAVQNTHFGGKSYVFKIQTGTTFYGAASLSDLNVGDEISVDYFSMRGQNTAENIVMEKRTYPDREPVSVGKVLISD